jgi:branched-chain amino acid transport system permease protein
MQQRSVTADQFTFVAGLPIFLVAVIGGLGMVGTGLFTGVGYIGVFNLLGALAPWAQNLVAILPGLAGVGLARHPDGIVARLRRAWAPFARDRAVAGTLLCGLTAAWLLRLAGAINGWVFAGGALVLVLALRAYLAVRAATPARLDVPVEWWGVRRAWRPEDREVLDRGVAAS